MRFDIQQIWILFWWKRQQHRSYLQWSQSASWLQPPGFRKGYAFLKTDTLNFLLLLPDRAIFSWWSMGTIAVRAQLGSLTPTFMLIFSTTWTLFSNLATLARVAKLVAVEATHRVGNKQGHLHLQIADRDLFREVWSVEGQKQGVGGDLFRILLHRHPVDLNYTMFLQFRLDFHLRHAGQFTAADDTTWRVQHFVDGDTYWSINKSVVLRKPIACDFLAHSTRKDPFLNLLMLLRVPATAWKPFWTAKGNSLFSGRSSLDDSMTRNHGQLLQEL